MSHRIWTVTLAAMFLLVGPINAQEAGQPDRLFRSNDVLEITITAPLETLMDERPLDEDLPGKLSYVDEAGATIEFDIGLRTRGRYRRQQKTCPFAPIRLNFQKMQTKDTLFNKQDKLKLVTHCRDNSTRYEQVALKEYLSYRIFNEVTPLSYRVRLLHINYVDTENPNKERIRYGFLIEHRDRLAKRIKLPHLEIERTWVGALNGTYTNLSSVFQFFIANTDFSPIAGAADDFCCHNASLFGNQGEMLYPIPYDFDMAGLTDAPYATANPKFRIRNVRQRVYRGRCSNNEHLPTSLQMFRDNREKFSYLIDSMPDLSGSSTTSMYSLIDKFYKLINNPRAVEKKLVKACV